MSGHIQGACGDHGLFKVHFGKQIMAHDTVCLNLFKRVYPKFATPEQLGGGAGGGMGAAEEEEEGGDGLAGGPFRVW